MRLLFEMDKQDYGNCTRTFVRNSARSIIVKDNKIAMIHSEKYDYYKFPGGGIEAGESPIDAMIRETLEEAGLKVIPNSIKEYGYVHRIQRSDKDPLECFIQDNFYYICKVEENQINQNLDGYEKDESYILEFVSPYLVIEKNRNVKNSPYNSTMFEREVRVIEMLILEGFVS